MIFSKPKVPDTYGIFTFFLKITNKINYNSYFSKLYINFI